MNNILPARPEDDLRLFLRPVLSGLSEEDRKILKVFQIPRRGFQAVLESRYTFFSSFGCVILHEK